MSFPAAENVTAPLLHGEVVYFYAFDFAYDMQRAPLHALLGCPLEPFAVDARKRVPRGQVFYRPLMARLPALELQVRGQPVRLEPAVKVLPIGALSVTVRAPVTAQSVADCAAWHGLTFDDGTTLDQWVLETVEQARAELADRAIRPHERLPEAESYTVFCLDAASPGLGAEAAAWLENNRTAVAGLLMREADAALLSSQEVTESTGRWLSYYRHDLTVVDWDAALVIDRPDEFDETLYIMELANVQLEELEAYDAYIDEALERAYRDLNAPRGQRRRHVLREVKELRIDLARFSDELSNITKFFGEWHLARVYETTARLFHLADWHRAIDEKLSTLDSLYDMLKQDQNHRTMVWLEGAIVLMFIIDLVLILVGMAQ
jgi:hypothetical protein